MSVEVEQHKITFGCRPSHRGVKIARELIPNKKAVRIILTYARNDFIHSGGRANQKT